jgi:hypothetical protein
MEPMGREHLPLYFGLAGGGGGDFKENLCFFLVWAGFFRLDCPLLLLLIYLFYFIFAVLSSSSYLFIFFLLLILGTALFLFLGPGEG